MSGMPDDTKDDSSPIRTLVVAPPPLRPDDLIAELHQIVGDEVIFELTRYEPGAEETDMGLFDTLAGILKDMDPGGAPIPASLRRSSNRGWTPCEPTAARATSCDRYD